MRMMHFLRATVLAGLAAFAAGMVTVFIASPVVRLEAAWASEALIGSAAAVAWMTVGLLIAGRHAAAAAPVIFVAGAAAAWFLSRGIVHSASPYQGLFTVSACCGGWIAWLLHARGQWSRPALATAFILPPVVALFGLSFALPGAPFGATRVAMAGDSVVAQVSVVLAESDENDIGWFVWSADDLMTAQTRRCGSRWIPGQVPEVTD